MIDYPIKVLLVEDSPIALEILSRLLCSSSNVKIVGKARNGKEALELIPKNPACGYLYRLKLER